MATRHLSALLLFAVSIPVSAAAQGTCPAANPNDNLADDVALNACLSVGGTVTLVSGSFGYVIETGLALTAHNTILQGFVTPGHAKPRLYAHPNLAATMLRVPPGVSLNGWVIRDLTFDGRRVTRNAALCLGSYWDRARGYNLQVRGSGWTIENVDSDNALCGTALEVGGDGYTIRNNSIFDPGYPYDVAPNPNAVADGITLTSCVNALVTGNYIANGTDVSLIVGEGAGCVVEYNTIHQFWGKGQVGLMVGFPGDHSGSVVRHNTVNSLPGLLPIGLLLGFHPFDANVTVAHAGNVESNNIQGAMTLAAVDGIGAGTFINNTGSSVDTSPHPLPTCAPGIAYTAGHFGSATLQPGWIPRTYHNGACQ